MESSVKRIIDFIKQWANDNGFAESNSQVVKFVSELQNEIKKMNFSVPEGTTIIAYSGFSNGEQTWKIAKQVSTAAGDGATYISDLPAGTLIGGENRVALVKALKEVVDQEYIEMIISGYDSSGNRIPGGSCGFGKGLLSLDDFVSQKLMLNRTLYQAISADYFRQIYLL